MKKFIIIAMVVVLVVLVSWQAGGWVGLTGWINSKINQIIGANTNNSG